MLRLRELTQPEDQQQLADRYFELTGVRHNPAQYPFPRARWFALYWRGAYLGGWFDVLAPPFTTLERLADPAVRTQLYADFSQSPVVEPMAFHVAPQHRGTALSRLAWVVWSLNTRRYPRGRVLYATHLPKLAHKYQLHPGVRFLYQGPVVAGLSFSHSWVFCVSNRIPLWQLLGQALLGPPRGKQAEHLRSQSPQYGVGQPL